MENASKALIMAAEVLIGVIVITIGVALYTIFSDYSKTTAEEINATQLLQFNNNFLKYEGDVSPESGKIKPIEITAHDIITVANFARQNNIQNGFYKLENNQFKPIVKSTKTDNQGLHYVQVSVHGASKYEHMEAADENIKNDFIKDNSINSSNEPKLFVCAYPSGQSTIKISDITKKVIYIEFYEI